MDPSNSLLGFQYGQLNTITTLKREWKREQLQIKAAGVKFILQLLFLLVFIFKILSI